VPVLLHTHNIYIMYIILKRTAYVVRTIRGIKYNSMYTRVIICIRALHKLYVYYLYYISIYYITFYTKIGAGVYAREADRARRAVSLYTLQPG